MQRTNWRLISNSPTPGPWNMAVDEAIFEAVIDHRVPPTLRLYAWDPPCLSLGLAQPCRDVDLDALQKNGWDLVRRPTGGRAILHTDELTYSVAAPLDEPRISGGVLESYQRLSQALLSALHRLGLPAQSEKEYPLSPGSQPNGAVCFEVPSKYEIVVSGRKLIGSAQARRMNGVLQHGSLPLFGDLTRITRVLAYPDDAAREQAAQRLLDHATTLELLGYHISWQDAAVAFYQAFEETLSLNLVLSDLTQEERQRAAGLVEQKYCNPDWTNRL